MNILMLQEKLKLYLPVMQGLYDELQQYVGTKCKFTQKFIDQQNEPHMDWIIPYIPVPDEILVIESIYLDEETGTICIAVLDSDQLTISITIDEIILC